MVTIERMRCQCPSKGCFLEIEQLLRSPYTEKASLSLLVFGIGRIMMYVLKLLPVILSGLLLGAHFLRAGLFALAVLSLVFPVLLLFRRGWVARLVQIILVLGALEWIRTLMVLVDERRIAGQAWTRLAIILGLVAVFTGCSALVFCCRSLKNRYKLGKLF
jgi:hypothetical protein